MTAKVSRKFERGFELNEEGLRRLHADMRKRIPEDFHNNIVIEVFREDSLIYKTVEIDRVLSESNDSTVKIISITIGYKDNNIDINIRFDSESGAELIINGEDRDSVFLIYSDLKEYIQKEIAFIRSRLITKRPLVLFAAPLMVFSGMAIFLASNNAIPTDELKSIIESTETNDKLNFIINYLYNTNSGRNSGKYIMLVPALLSIMMILPTRRIARYLYPYNTFMIGKQTSIINNRKSLTKNLFWVVVVGALVSFCTGYYFFWLAK